MSTHLDLSGLDRLRQRLQRIANPDPTPLMTSWMKTIDDDNRQGVMAGLDKDGNLMVPVKYRPVGLKTSQIRHARRQRGAFQGLGVGQPTSAEYRRMTGPPLAPRGMGSRVITNLRLRFGRLASGVWEVVGYWDQVVNRHGQRFLHYHFDGATGGGRKRNVTLPRRDLRGVRPGGVEKARNALRAWMIDIIRTYGP
jgi:hypothetical protein